MCAWSALRWTEASPQPQAAHSTGVSCKGCESRFHTIDSSVSGNQAGHPGTLLLRLAGGESGTGQGGLCREGHCGGRMGGITGGGGALWGLGYTLLCAGKAAHLTTPGSAERRGWALLCHLSEFTGGRRPTSPASSEAGRSTLTRPHLLPHSLCAQYISVIYVCVLASPFSQCINAWFLFLFF